MLLGSPPGGRSSAAERMAREVAMRSPNNMASPKEEDEADRRNTRALWELNRSAEGTAMMLGGRHAARHRLLGLLGAARRDGQLGGGLSITGTRCRIFERPTREEIRRAAVWYMGLQERGFSAGRAGVRSPPRMLACGLFEDELLDILCRDLTPEDYEMLCKLDETVPKKTASASLVEKLQIRTGPPEGSTEPCGVCLAPFDDEDEVATVPCAAKHTFHKECISKWLLDCKNSCPLCGEELG